MCCIVRRYIEAVLKTLLVAQQIVVSNCVHSLVEDCQLQTACFVHELILIRKSVLELTNNVHLSREELDK